MDTTAANPSRARAEPHDFRRAVARFATGITVVTSEDEGGVRGMTCNSFTSVSLDPATILISLRPGRTHDAILASRTFGVSILRDEHQSYSSYFSGPPKPEAPPKFLRRQTAPTLAECIAWFECGVVETVRVHDHTLFVAQVTACGVEDGAPLMFYESRYHRYDMPPANRLPQRDASGS